MSYETLNWEQKGVVGYLSLSRPKSLNALNAKVFKELEDCLSSLDESSLRVLIVQGAGEKAFVAGADIKEMSSLNSKEAEEFSKTGQRVFSLLEALPFPVIAAIQGFALGGGLELALACDILLLEENSKLGFPEVTLGLFPSFGGTQRLTRAIGFYKAKEMIFSGNFYTAQSAYAMGLVNEILPKSGLIKRAEELSKTFQQRGPLAISQAKQLIQKNGSLDLETALQIEAQEFGRLFDKEDSREGMKAFIEKRSPQFKGN